MKIASIEVYEHILTYAHGEYVMSSGRAATSQVSTLVRVVTDEGLDGWGETCPLDGTYLPTFAAALRQAIAAMGRHLVGLDPRNINAIGTKMSATLMGFEAAKSAIDLACWDVSGKSLGVPVSALLGGVLQESFPLYEAVPLATPEAMAAFIAERRAVGIACFQVKVGNDPGDDVARAEAAADVAGDCTLICDSNGGWTVDQAITAVRGMADLPIYVEQPCRTTAASAQVRRVTNLPFVMDESIALASDLATAVETVAPSAINLKLSRLGGISAVRRMRDNVVALDLSVCLEDTWGGDIVTAAVAHLAATTPARHLLSTSFFNDWTNEHVAHTRPQSVNGRGSAPAGPGLGVEVDASQLGEPLFIISN